MDPTISCVVLGVLSCMPCLPVCSRAPSGGLCAPVLPLAGCVLPLAGCVLPLAGCVLPCSLWQKPWCTGGAGMVGVVCAGRAAVARGAALACTLPCQRAWADVRQQHLLRLLGPSFCCSHFSLWLSLVGWKPRRGLVVLCSWLSLVVRLTGPCQISCALVGKSS